MAYRFDSTAHENLRQTEKVDAPLFRQRRPHCRDIVRQLLLSIVVAFTALWDLPLAASGREDQVRDARILTQGFLSYHPDIKYRLEGLAHLEDGEVSDAVKAFTRAAKYADKVSQAALGELIWTGMLPNRGRAEAYAWMDLAAERGYVLFVAKREKYWAELDEEERAAAIDVGQRIYAEYGDDVAKPRIKEMLRRGRVAITGSRVGYVGRLEIVIPGPGGLPISISGDEFYQDRLWRPQEYFAWQDRVWGLPPSGQVTVGDIESESTEGASKAPSD